MTPTSDEKAIPGSVQSEPESTQRSSVFPVPRSSDEARDREDVQRFVADAARVLSESLEYEHIIERAAQLPIPRLADWCFVDVRRDDESFERVGVGHVPRADTSELAQRLCRRYSLSTPRGGVVEAIREERTLILSDVKLGELLDLAQDEEHRELIRRVQPCSAVIAPMQIRQKNIGALSLLRSTNNFSVHDVWVVEQLARSAAAAIENARLFDAERRAHVRVIKLQEVTAALSRASTAREVAEVACRIGTEAMEAHSGALWLLGPGGSLNLVGSWGAPDTFMEQFRTLDPQSNAPAFTVIRENQPLWVETVDDYRRLAPDYFQKALAADRLSAFGAVPIVIDGRAQGVIVFAHSTGHQYDLSARAFYLTVAHHCSHALERSRLLERERAARSEAELANRVKDDFLAIVSHELRTPLNAILGWANIASSKATDDFVRKGLDVIHRNARAQAKIIEDILDVSRIIAGKLKLEVRELDFAAIVQEAIEVVQPSAEAKNVRLTFSAQASDAALVGDADRLQQVVWNLLSNAIKFTEAGGSVDVTLERSGPLLTLTIRDTGCGMSPEFVPKVFERFRQADSSTARKFGGLGLGLTIVRHLIELHGGRVSADSLGVGQGSTFRVEVPIRAEEMADVDKRHSSKFPVAAPESLSGLRILLVEDDKDTRDFLKASFELEGNAVYAAASADEACAALDTAAFDLLLSDIGMPDRDGYDLIRSVRARSDAASAIPAIALTAYVRDTDRAAALNAGFNAHLPKPLDRARLATTVRSLLNARSSAGI
jgi:signal transduction histidine kinase/ActR/RegA family two-component response regulator